MKKLLFLALIALVSCSTSKESAYREKITTSSDTAATSSREHTIIEKQIVHDTSFQLLPDTASLLALIECSKEGEALLKQVEQLRSGKQIKQQIRIKDNYIYVESTVDSSVIAFHYYNTHRYEFEGKKDSVTIKKEQTTTQQSSTKVVKTRTPVWFYLLGSAIAFFIVYSILKKFII